MSAPFFPDVGEPIAFEGLESDNPLAFRWYDRDRLVGGRRMRDHLRCSVAYWHSFNWTGFDVFGAGTLDRPWLRPGADPMEQARGKMAAAFEFLEKLGAPFFCFHDRDIAPEGATFQESSAFLHQMADEAAGYMERTGVGLLWGTELVLPPSLRRGSRDQPRPRRVRLRRRPGSRLPGDHAAARRCQLRGVGRT